MISTNKKGKFYEKNNFRGAGAYKHTGTHRLHEIQAAKKHEGGVGNGALALLAKKHPSGQDVYADILLYVNPNSEHSEKVIHIKAIYAYLICSAEAETNGITDLVRREGRHRQLHPSLSAADAV